MRRHYPYLVLQMSFLKKLTPDIVDGLIQYEGQDCHLKPVALHFVTVDSNILRRCLRNIFGNASESVSEDMDSICHNRNSLEHQISNDGSPMIPEEKSKDLNRSSPPKHKEQDWDWPSANKSWRCQATLKLLPHCTDTTFQITIPLLKM